VSDECASVLCDVCATIEVGSDDAVVGRKAYIKMHASTKATGASSKMAARVACGTTCDFAVIGRDTYAAAMTSRASANNAADAAGES
jgi:hypothetical protein